MSIRTNTIQKSQKFINRQNQFIKEYGEKTVMRTKGVTQEILDTFTPLRRLHKKPCSLSDTEYFIDKFESSTKKELPQIIWENLKPAEKIDYIVKVRYKKLIVNKILEAIKNEQIEHNFILSENGEIIAYNKGNHFSVCIKDATDLLKDLLTRRQKHEKIGNDFAHLESEIATTTVHNHTPSYNDITSCLSYNIKMIFADLFGIKPDIETNPNSIKDILGDMERMTDGYVIDSRGHKFHFIPNLSILEELEMKCAEFETKGNAILAKYNKIYEEEKEELMKLQATKGIDSDTIKQQQANVIKAYADLLKEQLQFSEYRKLLSSDYFKENFGHFEQF